MIVRIAAGLLLGSCISLSVSANNLEHGLDAYQCGDFREAVEQWRPSADSGNAAAEFNLGLMYETGQGVAQDFTEAAKWYRKAADQGWTDAQNNLAFLYLLGRGIPKDVTKAVAWYRKAASQGNVGAQFSLGSLYLEGIGVPDDHAKAIAWYRKAADQGYPLAQYNLGAMYDSGQGVEKNHAAAVGWYRKAARQGHADAKRRLGLLASSKPKAAPGMPLPLHAGQEEDTQQAAHSSDTLLPAFRIQLASVKSNQPNAAQEMANRLNQTHGTVLDRLKVIPVRANLGDRGLYYRLRAGPIPEFGAAKRICKQLQEREQACIVLHAQQSN